MCHPVRVICLGTGLPALDPGADGRLNHRSLWLPFNVTYFQCTEGNYKRWLVNGFVLLSPELQEQFQQFGPKEAISM